MANPELFVLLLNAVVTGFAYFYIYPKFCGSDGNKITIYDLFVGSIPLLVKGIIFGAAALHSILFFSPHIGSSVRLDTSLPWPHTSLLRRH